MCFNPRPTRRPGATHQPLVQVQTNRGFNPRPTRRPGATTAQKVKENLIQVSILARPEGRALLRLGEWRATASFVSILARPEGRALRKIADSRSRDSGFQSSPDPKAGRYITFLLCIPLTHRFQSSPDPKAGRYISSISGCISRYAVSILARPEGRALPVI